MSDIIKIDENNWETRILRFTGFTAPENQILKTDIWETWWESITHNKPENRVNNLREGFIVDSGKFEAGLLKIEIRQNRIDLLYEHNINSDLVKLPSLGEFSAEAGKFNDLVVAELFRSIKELLFTRIAFGAIFYKPTETIENAFETLSKHVSCIDFGKVAKNPDFEFRVNRPRLFEDKDLKVDVNRLMKWNAQLIQIYYMRSNMVAPKMFEIPGAFVEIDINTHIKNDITFDVTKTVNIFNEFVKMGIEISEKGDI